MTTAIPKHVALHGQMAALSFFGIKEAQHALDRLNERTKLPSDLVPLLEAEADSLSGKVPDGFYYLPLKGKVGEHVGYAAFKTVPAYPHSRLVLATVLAPHMKPKGSSLSHVMTQPKVASVFDADDANATPYDRVVRRRFNDLAETMRTQGAYAGTAHKRIVIPKDRLTEQDINALGFTPVTIAIPEAGQDRFQSFRHHDNNFHIHSHPSGWTMHEDGHAAATMLAKKAKGLGEKTKAMVNGIPHMSEEGLPGLYYYIKGAIGGHRSTAERVFRELPTDVKLKVYGMAPSPTAVVNNLKQELQAKRDKMAAESNEPTPRQKAAALVIDGLNELRQKLADVITELKPHQQRVVDRMKDPNQSGLIAVHGLGSGKTLTSIAVADALGMPADVVVPAALQANYAKEMMKHTTTPPDARILSMENTARKGWRSLERPFMVVDEAHRLRNPGKTQSTLMKSPAEKKLLLTGSLVYNHPSDMAPLINMVAGEKTLPQNPSEFEGRYIRERRVGPGFWGGLTGAPSSTVLEVNPRTKEELRQILKKYVDYHPGSTEGFPSREDQVIRVQMTEHQRKLDDALMEDLPPWAREKILKNLPPSKSEAKQLNTFMNAIRQNANTTQGFDLKTDPQQPKIDRAVQELQKILETNPRAKAVIYSNYLNSGINPYKAQLDKHKIPYGEFTGQMTKKERDALVQQYNEDKLKALLLSSAGGEGLDLKGTNLIQVLEPHWNEEKIKQVIGRGIRFKSHDHLPEEQRKILVQRFLTTRPRVGMLERMKFKDPGGSADEYLYNRSNEKEQLNQQFRALLN